ncbi:MAG: hypothetical protein Q8S39_01870, partial [Ignavibacteria bacterium]|nr:hypothetical protein [Ignavibacteria bacterium]
MKSNYVIIATAFAILTIISILLYDLHNSAETEIIKRFNEEQLTAVNQILKEFESSLLKNAQRIEKLSLLPSLQNLDMKSL